MRSERRQPQGKVGRYAIQGEIATGGMATVHYGRLLGPGGFTRGVAIKRLHPQFAKDPHFVAMFLDEARLASRILHPNVVPILDVVADEGELFLVMEFVPGEAISKLFRKTPEGVPASIASSIGVGMLEGLHAAHEARGDDGEALSIVHRDVSPQNVLIGSDGVARLIDFGVAKAVGNASATRDGQIKGKVAYMAPEQIRCEPVDRRADIYAASVVLWELITGKRYFDEAGSDAAVVLRTLTKEPVAPSKVRPEVSPELDAVILKGVSRDPADRYATAREMAQALEKVSPPAAARDVARWVDAKAGDALRFRAHQFSSFDHSIATELPGRSSLSKPPPPDDSGKTPPTVTAVPSPAASEGDKPAPASAKTAGATPASMPSAERSADPAILEAEIAAPQRRSRTVFVAVPALLVAGVLGFLLARMVPSQAQQPERAPAAEPTTLKQPEPAVSAVASAPVAPPAASSAPQAAASEAPVASATAKPRSTPPIAPHGGGRVPPSSGGGPKPGCNPPYRITADGVREYKPECL
jgi:serine/threonine-protein kinase